MQKYVTSIEQYVINVVKNKRLEHNLTQAGLANILNVSPGFIGKVESRKYSSKYNINHINKLSKYFNCSPQDFLPKEAIDNDSD